MVEDVLEELEVDDESCVGAERKREKIKNLIIEIVMIIAAFSLGYMVAWEIGYKDGLMVCAERLSQCILFK